MCVKSCRSRYLESGENRPNYSIREINEATKDILGAECDLSTQLERVNLTQTNPVFKYIHATKLKDVKTRNVWIKMMVRYTQVDMASYFMLLRSMSRDIQNGGEHSRDLLFGRPSNFWDRGTIESVREYWINMVAEYRDYICFGKIRAYFLHSAVSAESWLLLELLISLGCNPECENDKGNTIYDLMVTKLPPRSLLQKIVTPNVPFETYRKIACQYPEWIPEVTTVFTLAYCSESPFFHLPKELIHHILLL